jgi:hypothetical protein
MGKHVSGLMIPILLHCVACPDLPAQCRWAQAPDLPHSPAAACSAASAGAAPVVTFVTGKAVRCR